MNAKNFSHWIEDIRENALPILLAVFFCLLFILPFYLDFNEISPLRRNNLLPGDKTAPQEARLSKVTLEKRIVQGSYGDALRYDLRLAYRFEVDNNSYRNHHTFKISKTLESWFVRLKKGKQDSVLIVNYAIENPQRSAINRKSFEKKATNKN